MAKATKLKKMQLNSVDLVRRGANQEAHIALAKSDYPVDDDFQFEDTNKSFSDKVKDAFNTLAKAFNLKEEKEEDVQKADDTLNFYVGALSESFNSIMKDNSIEMDEKVEMIGKSLTEFNETLDDYLSSFDTVDKSYDELDELQDYTVTQKSSKGEDIMMNEVNIDKSLLSQEEAALLDSLIAKASPVDVDDENDVPKKKAGTVDPAGNQEVEEENLPPEVKKALDMIQAETAELKKAHEMKELAEIAKKYAVLGKKEEELTKSLYDMKQVGEDVYKTYTDALDGQLELVNKSGIFSEIGKSGSYQSVAKSEPEAKIEAIASEIMKSENIDRTTALAKAWEQNPELADAYNATYHNN